MFCPYVPPCKQLIRGRVYYTVRVYVLSIHTLVSWKENKNESSLIRLKYIYVHVYVQSVSVHSLAQMCRLTFVVGGVVDTEISVPDDGQLHGKTAHLHPTVEVLLPWQPQSESEKGDKLVSYFEMVYYLSWLCYHSIHLKHTVKGWQQEHR